MNPNAGKTKATDMSVANTRDEFSCPRKTRRTWSSRAAAKQAIQKEATDCADDTDELTQSHKDHEEQLRTSGGGVGTRFLVVFVAPCEECGLLTVAIPPWPCRGGPHPFSGPSASSVQSVAKNKTAEPLTLAQFSQDLPDSSLEQPSRSQTGHPERSHGLRG